MLVRTIHDLGPLLVPRSCRPFPARGAQGGGCAYKNCRDGPSCPGGACSFENCDRPSCRGEKARCRIASTALDTAAFAVYCMRCTTLVSAISNFLVVIRNAWYCTDHMQYQVQQYTVCGISSIITNHVHDTHPALKVQNAHPSDRQRAASPIRKSGL